MLHQSHGTLFVAFLIIVELHEYHPFPRVGVAYHHVAQQSNLLSEVKESHVVAYSVVADGVAYLVLQIIHKVAFLYRQNLVEGTCYVEAYGTHLASRLACGNLLTRHPAFV